MDSVGREVDGDDFEDVVKTVKDSVAYKHMQIVKQLDNYLTVSHEFKLSLKNV